MWAAVAGATVKEVVGPMRLRPQPIVLDHVPSGSAARAAYFAAKAAAVACHQVDPSYRDPSCEACRQMETGNPNRRHTCLVHTDKQTPPATRGAQGWF